MSSMGRGWGEQERSNKSSLIKQTKVLHKQVNLNKITKIKHAHEPNSKDEQGDWRTKGERQDHIYTQSQTRCRCEQSEKMIVQTCWKVQAAEQMLVWTSAEKAWGQRCGIVCGSLTWGALWMTPASGCGASWTTRTKARAWGQCGCWRAGPQDHQLLIKVNC